MSNTELSSGGAVAYALSDIPPLPWAVESSSANPISNETTVLSSDPRVVEFFGVQTSASGMAVTAETAQRVATVYACVTKIAGGISTMPLRIYERVWDGQLYQRRPVDDIDLWWMLNESPCPAYTAASHWEHGVESFLLRGDGFTEIRRKPSGKFSEFIPHKWEAVTPKRRDNGRLIYAVSDGYGTRGVEQDDMFHFAGFGFDGERSPSVISKAAKQSIGNALAMDEYSGRVFAGGAHHSMVLETDKKINDELLLTMQRTFAEKYSGMRNAHTKPLILTEGLKARTVTMSPEDVQLMDAKRYSAIDICRAFGVPPHMIGETSASTSWGSGIESMGRAFVTYTLQPHLVRMEQELNRKLFRTAKYFVEFDRDALMAGDSKAQADADKAALGGPGSGPGCKSVNEVRRSKHLPPIDDPKYDKPYWPPDKSTSPSGTGRSQPDPNEPTPPDPWRGEQT
ncbi:MAG: phage portal protein [Aquabacterium sp.]|uniref:phage portal protein n=1 Tax=Aquabacterium sp. TaxID=1872578 RepID=UPI0012288F00|nr:phage portal protein [Aquabacterium sp.]TAK84519.1 MAG: phage portal protein [Aquabacterium sp.]